MGKKYRLKEHEPATELRVAARVTTKALIRTRLTVIARILEEPGVGSRQLCQEYLVDRNTITGWVKLYNEGGMGLLQEMKKRGVRPGSYTWSEEMFQALFDEINKQEEHWSGPKMQVWLEERFGKEVPLRTIYNRLRMAGISYKSGRPTPYKGNGEEQEAFKKRD
jgi:transposase